MIQWVEDLVSFASSNLRDNGRDALLDRGVSGDQIELYRLGRLRNELPEGVPEDFAKWAHGKMDDVFLLPLTTALGDIRGFQLRHVDRKIPGYQDYFVGRQEACLFGLGQAVKSMWETRMVTLVEGAFDLFPVQRATPAVVATLTAHTNTQFARVLRRVVSRVLIAYDNDSGGEKGARDFRSSYGNEFEVYVLRYPPPVNGVKIKDPGILWEVWGDAQLVPYIRNSMLQEM